MFPPKRVSSLAANDPNILRDRTLMPRTTPRLWTMLKPSSSKVVVVIS